MGSVTAVQYVLLFRLYTTGKGSRCHVHGTLDCFSVRRELCLFCCDDKARKQAWPVTWRCCFMYYYPSIYSRNERNDVSFASLIIRLTHPLTPSFSCSESSCYIVHKFGKQSCLPHQHQQVPKLPCRDACPVISTHYLPLSPTATSIPLSFTSKQAFILFYLNGHRTLGVRQLTTQEDGVVK